MDDDDLDAAIVEARVAGESEREICRRLRCTPARVERALDERAARRLAPESVERMLVTGSG